VSVFRPAVRVTAPDGREWEVYAYRIKVRDPTPRTRGRRLLRVPRLLVRAAAVAVAAVRALRSSEWTIEAITFQPRRTAYTWTTTSEFKGQVLAQVEGNLARGDVPQRLSNAVYRGEDRRSAR
jgi:hypothetical protein